MLPSQYVSFVEPGQPAQIAEALSAAMRAGPANGELRAHYLAHFTPQRHLAKLRSALLSASS
jgi:hypothetical protein